MDKKDKYISTSYYLASICFYISAGIHFINKDFGGFATYFCLGITFFVLALDTRKKGKNK